MIKFFTYLFDKWWLPILILGLTVVLIVTGNYIESSYFIVISILLFCLALLILLSSAIYQIVKKRLVPSLVSGLAFIGSIGTAGVVLLIGLISFLDGKDKWADKLKLPDNIPLSTPVGDGFNKVRPDSIIGIKKTNTDFVLYNSFQPGLYEYDFWTGRIDRGIIYLKAFEITGEEALSASSLRERSEVKIYNPTDSILRFGTSYDFTIYEGDWGKPYGARFEVWYKPDNGGETKKLFERNYKIEGWMR